MAAPFPKLALVRGLPGASAHQGVDEPAVDRGKMRVSYETIDSSPPLAWRLALDIGLVRYSGEAAAETLSWCWNAPAAGRMRQSPGIEAGTNRGGAANVTLQLS